VGRRAPKLKEFKTPATKKKGGEGFSYHVWSSPPGKVNDGFTLYQNLNVMLKGLEKGDKETWGSPQGEAARRLREVMKTNKNMSSVDVKKLIRVFDRNFEPRRVAVDEVYKNIVDALDTKRVLFPEDPSSSSDAGSALGTPSTPLTPSSSSTSSSSSDGTSSTSVAMGVPSAAAFAAELDAAVPVPKHMRDPDEKKDGVDDTVGGEATTKPPSGPHSIASGGGPAIEASADVAEGVVLTAATNMAGNDKSNEKAAGDSGLGNAMKYDFITGTGRGKPGQVIQRGDQRSLVTEKNRIKAADDKATDGKNNNVGINLTTPEQFAALVPQSGGDKILDPEVLDTGRASLRPQFLLGGEDAVRKTGVERMEMDVQFDMFDYVPDGFGLGAHNKMYVQEKNHERLIRYREPLYAPRREDGSEYIAVSFDERLEAAMKPGGVTNWMKRTSEELASLGSAIKRQKVASVDTLADDNNAQRSSKGLRGRKPSPFETVINTKSPWIPTTEPAGVFMKRQLKSVFNTQRTPQANVEQNPHNGGPTLGKKEAMAIILP
jgi:hypothetical protein